MIAEHQAKTSSGTDFQALPTFKVSVSISAVSAGISDEEVIFDGLAANWKQETKHLSVLAQRYKHPAYIAILNMGRSVVPFMLKELQRNPDRWFDALERLTGANPAKEATTFDEALERWLAWGRSNNYIS
jgi:hypothetical protein